MTSVDYRKLRLLTATGMLLVFAVTAFAQGAPGKGALAQIVAIEQAKHNLSDAHRKMDSGLAFASAGLLNPKALGSIKGGSSPFIKTQSGKIVVDIHGSVTSALLQHIKQAGGDVLYSSPRWNTVRAAVPLASMESVAGNSDVTRVSSRVWAHTNVGSVTSQGYVAHRAKQVVEQQGVSGAGVTVGVLSDSCSASELSALQSSGDLPVNASALSGQNGSGEDEGCAMMEIVYDMAPGSTPVFATAFNGQASFADNIVALQQAGAKVIVDDVTYFEEPVFQDGIIAQAVNQVTANGTVYFSSAANSGSKTMGTSGTWEGDFKDGGPVSGLIASIGETGFFHNFGTTASPQVYDSFTATPSGYVFLQWSDPWGNSCDDYDVFVTDSTGNNLKAFSADAQTCSGSDPVEGLFYGAGSSGCPTGSEAGCPKTGDRIYVVLFAGTTRALHVDTERSNISINTHGATFGHNAGQSTICMAATYWGSAKKGLVPFTGAANPVETFSSDGPRKIFYDPSGNPITPGNVLFATNGGTTLKKPDITAADGIFTKTPGFLPFFGTSAAAPHAAGIAALVLQVRPGYGPSDVWKAMTATALNNMAAGWDENGGYGVAMADGAVNYALTH